MQAGARRVHPAREDPLHLALQRDLVDLDEGVGVGGFGRRPRVAGAGLHPQRAELHGLADILVEIDDAAGDLVEPREARLLVGDLRAPAARTRPRRPAAGSPALAARPWAGAGPAAALPGGGALATPGCAGLRRRNRDARLGVLRNDGGAGRRRQRLRLQRSGRRQRPAPAADGSASAAGGPRGSSGTSSSSSGSCCRLRWLPRGMAPGGRSGGSEKILPICACAGGASEIVVAAIRAAKPVRAMVRNISRL